MHDDDELSSEEEDEADQDSNGAFHLPCRSAASLPSLYRHQLHRLAYTSSSSISPRAEENDYRNDYPENDEGLDAAGAYSSDGGFSNESDNDGGDSSDEDADRDARMGGWGGGDEDDY
jgi:hypothetical protein